MKAPLPDPPNSPLQVAVCVDKTRRYGRKVLQGIADYMEVAGPWSIDLDPEATGSYSTDWIDHWKGDGILAFVESEATAKRLIASKIPCVEIFGHHFGLNLPQVGNDDIAVGAMAANHLLACRFKHYAFCGYEEERWSQRRREGFQEVIQGGGFEVCHFSSARRQTTLAKGQQDRERLIQWLRDLPKPIAIMACSDRQGQRILSACSQLDLSSPEEVAVIGVDNDEETCRLSDPPLSSVEDDPRKIGFEAARILNELMTNQANSEEKFPVLIPPLGIAVRRSTEITAVDDPLVQSAMRSIREQACNGLRVTDLTARFNVSRSVLYRRFKESLNRSPHEEIIRVQLERAKRLLDESDFTLDRIADLCGFRHSEYLGVVFKRKLGVTPGAYRRRHHP